MPDPRFLDRAEAARYLGVSATTFDQEVKTGLWPAPIRRGTTGRALTWDRLALDRAADRLSNLTAGPAPENPHGEAAALEASRRGAAEKRPQYRHQKAA